MVLLQRLIRFALVGGLATAIQYVLLVVLVELAALPAVTASCLGFGVSACFNYFANYRFTFHSNAPHRSAAARFAATALTGLLLNALLMHVLVATAHLNYLIAQLITTALVLLFNFMMSSRWVFTARPLGRANGPP